jgi:uncharacterized protein YfaS (alpha-2-macroglobulin family)
MDIFPSKISPGATALIETIVRQAIPFQTNDQLIDGTLAVSIYDPDGNKVLDSAPMIRFSLGRYTYNYTFPVDAIPGLYTIEITATAMGNTGIDTTTIELINITNT